MICKDCGMDFEKLSTTGICSKCAKRKNNASYRKIPYVPLVVLKGTPAYNIAIGKRFGGIENAPVDIVQDIQQDIQQEPKILEADVSTEDTQRQLAIDTVNKDIEDAIKRLNINEKTLDIPFELVLDSFCNIFDKTIIKSKELMQKEYDTLIADRLHVLLHTDDYKEICQVGLEEKYIQEKRVVLKNELRLYDPFKTIVDNLLNDEIYKEQIKIAIEEYQQVKEKLVEAKYVTDTLSMKGKDFVKSYENNTMRTIVERGKNKKFYCAVGCYNLYGNKQKDLLEVKGGIVATDEADAKEKFKKFIKTYFDSVVYTDKDIIIKEMVVDD